MANAMKRKGVRKGTCDGAQHVGRTRWDEEGCRAAGMRAASAGTISDVDAEK
jgi:hypothetical protein